MKVKKTIKLGFKILGIAISALYLIIVCISAARMNDIVKIEYSSSAFGVTINSTEIDLVNKSIHKISYDMSGKVISEHTAKFSESKLNIFKTTCILCYFPMWRKNYENKHIMDGDYWRVVTTYEDGTKKKTNGHEAYPLTYEFFLNSIPSI